MTLHPRMEWMLEFFWRGRSHMKRTLRRNLANVMFVVPFLIVAAGMTYAADGELV
jgi:hypothetical protein